MRFRSAVLFFVLIFLIVLPLPLGARVMRVQIATLHDVLDGKPFGDAGAYERITGRIYFSLPVANPHNQGRCDKVVSLRNFQATGSVPCNQAL